jgi:hypothetical protein
MDVSMIRHSFPATSALAGACAMVACGGASADADGYMKEGHVVSALRPGLASLVIGLSGQARIGV